MKKFFAFLFLFVAVLLFAQLAFAQTSSESATTTSLTFPIAELGNCSSAAACKTYCDDPTHLDACIAYAKEKGFYKENNLDTSKDAVLADAKATLGCDSLDACRTFCQQAANATACSAFAQKHNLKGGSNRSVSNSILKKAEATLGCTNEADCKTFCQQESNKEKCGIFAKENGLRGGDEAVGPGGCTSESSCKTYCSNPDNFQTCSEFVQSHNATGSAQKSFTGPGGCTSEESCKEYCQQNPSVCHMMPANHQASDSAKGEREGNSMHVRMPSGIPDHMAGSSGNITPRQNPTGLHEPSSEIHPSISQLPQQPEGDSFQTVNQESVKAAETHRDFFSWIVDTLFHLQ